MVYSRSGDYAFIPEFSQHLQHMNPDFFRVILKARAYNPQAVWSQYPAVQHIGLILLIFFIFLV